MGKKKGGDKRDSAGKDKKGKGKGGKRKKSSVVVAEAPVAAAPPPAEPVQEKCQEKGPCRYPGEICCNLEVACQPNRYPGMLDNPLPLAVVGSEGGSYDSICKLLRAGLRCADRVLAMTPWGNYVIFRVKNSQYGEIYFLFDGCTCNVNHFRYMDLFTGTAGLLYFETLQDIINYIIDSQHKRICIRKLRRTVIDDICKEFCDDVC